MIPPYNVKAAEIDTHGNFIFFKLVIHLPILSGTCLALPPGGHKLILFAEKLMSQKLRRLPSLPGLPGLLGLPRRLPSQPGLGMQDHW